MPLGSFDDKKFSKLIKPRDESEADYQEYLEQDNICPECDSTGEVGGRVCTNCNGKGYVNT